MIFDHFITLYILKKKIITCTVFTKKRKKEKKEREQIKKRNDNQRRKDNRFFEDQQVKGELQLSKSKKWSKKN